MQNTKNASGAVKYAILASVSLLLGYFNLNPTVEWIILGLDISLLIVFLIRDYGIKKKKVSKFDRTLWLCAVLVTIIMSIWIFEL